MSATDLTTDAPAGTGPEPLNAPGPKRWRVGTLVYTGSGLVALFCWLLWGDFAFSMRERSVTPIVQLMLKKHEASDMLISLFMGTLPSMCNMLIGPIISYRSDRHRGRWGRRIPFLLIPTPLVVLAAAGLALSPRLGGGLHQLLGSNSPGLNPSILIFLGLFWILFEVAVTVVGGTVFYGLINDVVPAPLIGRFFGMFRALSLIAGMIFNYWLLGKAEDHYATLILGIGVLFGLGFTLMCLKVKEGEYPPPPPVVAGGPRGFFGASRLYFRECFGQPYYLWVFAAITLPMIAFAPVYLFSIFFAKSVQMDLGDYGKYIALTFLVSLLMSYPLGALADRFHPLRVGIAAMLLHAVVTLWAGLCANDAPTFAVALVAETIFAAAWGTGAASLAQRLYPRSKFAQLASAQGLVFSIGSIFLAPAVGAFLDFTHHVYRYTFLISFGLTLLSLLALAGLHRRFMALGGPRDYAAPE